MPRLPRLMPPQNDDASIAPAADPSANTAQPLPSLLSAAETGILFNRSERAIRRWVQRGFLRPIRVGGAVFFSRKDVQALIAGRVRDDALDPSRGHVGVSHQATCALTTDQGQTSEIASPSDPP